LRVAPEGFRKLLNWIWDRYPVPIVVTENGCPCPGEENVDVAIDDQFRQRYLGLYLDSISRAVFEDGVKVVGYYAWSLMDNFGMPRIFLDGLFMLTNSRLEWSSGYGPRYGLVHVDFGTLKRTPKKSAYYLKETFQERRKKA
jgi:beta-glucosidase